MEDSGVFIDVFVRETARRAARRVLQRSARRGANPVLTLAELAAVPDGGSLAVPRGALVTPLVREAAWERDVALVDEGDPGAHAIAGGARRVAIGSDHGGYGLKAEITPMLTELGWRVLDLGTRDTNACDYPIFAQAVAEAVADGRAHVGIVVDGAGIGSCMAANKVPGVLAANCWDERTARNAREHNHANVLTLGAGHLDGHAAYGVVRTFLETPVGPGRHARRVERIHAIDVRYGRGARAGRDA
ncbi:MAG: RpiB/LacA/LacB family sugar-phosphate isomerase [bacterium]|nr:RpiB/LacA/LacB family sugar-phosphate isomerase [bacterium]